jgi:hypothetical protein
MSIHGVVIISTVMCALVAAVYACLKDIGRYKKENVALRREVQNAAEYLACLVEYEARDKCIGEEANNERQALKETADGDLVNRANALFGGVRDKGGTGGGVLPGGEVDGGEFNFFDYRGGGNAERRVYRHRRY